MNVVKNNKVYKILAYNFVIKDSLMIPGVFLSESAANSWASKNFDFIDPQKQNLITKPFRYQGARYSNYRVITEDVLG